MCAIVMVVMPRPSGQPIACSIATNSSSSESPVITSGITSGAVDEAGQQRAAAEAAEAREREAGERAEHGRARRIHRGDLERQPGGAEDLLGCGTARRTTSSRSPPQTVTRRDSLNE